MDSAAFANSLLNPVTKRISEAHKDVRLSPEQIVLIKQYLDNFKEEGLGKPKMLVTKLAFFILLIIIFTVTILDLSVTKIIKFKAQLTNLSLLDFDQLFLRHTWHCLLHKLSLAWIGHVLEK